MKLAIVGAGLSGLAVAVKAVQKGMDVTMYDPVGVGGGASGVASGLLHPYPGKKCLRSHRADEAMAASMELLQLVDNKVFIEGVVRRPVDAAQREIFQTRADEYDDLEWTGHELIVHSGVTVHCKKYLEGLWRYVEQRGGRIKREKIDEIPTGYERVVLAAGYGMKALMPDLPVRYNKGQILHCQIDGNEGIIIGDGYLARSEIAGEYHLGSTYEHDFTSVKPDQKVARSVILPKAKKYLKADPVITGVSAGVRVARIKEYFPIAERVSDQVLVLTAMGSRGLLYHAMLAQHIIDLA